MLHRAAALMPPAVLMISGCSLVADGAPMDHAKSEESTADSLSALDSSQIDPIEGNEAHNLLVGYNRLERGMALAAAVKKFENKQYCSPKRSLFRGRDGSNVSYWSIECHDGQSFQVALKPDESGSVLDCAVFAQLSPKDDCWKPFPVSNH